MNPETLTTHANFLRSLALELLDDASAADDVLQKAWLAASRKPPREPGRARAWLAVVVRNLARKELRESARRRRRESLFASADVVPPAERALEKQELVRAIVDAVFRLEEPYRTTVVLRFYENRKPAAIAREMGVPVETVRTRLKRALAELRRRLEQTTGGDRRSLGLAILGVFRPEVPTATLVASGSAMGLGGKLLVGAGVALLVAAPVLFVASWPDRVPTEPAAAARVATITPAEIAEPALVPIRAAAPAPLDPKPASVTPIEEDVARGTVEDADGAPLAGSRVEIALDYFTTREPLAEGVTDPDGRFAIDLAAATRTVSPYARDGWRVTATASRDGFTTVSDVVRSGLTPDAERSEPILVLHLEPKRVGGRVVDGDGRPVSGAYVGLIADGNDRVSWSDARSDETGGFSLPILSSGEFGVAAQAFDRGIGRRGPITLDSHHDATIGDIRLVGEGTLEGAVVAPDGSPVPDLLLRTSPERTVTSSVLQPYVAVPASWEGVHSGFVRTDSRGRFRLAGLLPGDHFLHLLPECPIEGNEGAFATGTTGIRLVVERYRVHLHVRDERGLPFEGAHLVYGSENGRGTTSSSLGAADRAVDVVPGERFLVSAQYPGRRIAEAALDVPVGEYESSLTLVLARLDDQPGSIRIDLRDREGRPLPCRATLLTTLRRTVVNTFGGRKLGPGETLETVPPGRYVLSMIPGEPLSWMERVTWFDAIEQPVEVRSGEVTRIEQTANAGARVRFTFRPPAHADAQTLTRSRFTVRSNGAPAERMRAFIVRLPGGDDRIGGRIDPHVPALSRDLFSPGTHVFLAEFEGFEPVETIASLRAGEITDVEVSLESRSD